MRKRFPRGLVHAVISRGKEYYYFSPGRGTKNAGKRERLPDDPQSEEFWAKLRQLQGIKKGGASGHTFEAQARDFLEWTKTKAADLAAGTQRLYRTHLEYAIEAWGQLDARSLRPFHTVLLRDEYEDQPGTANNIIGALSSFSRWALLNNRLDVALTHGVKRLDLKGGHHPWSPAMLAIIPTLGIKPGCDHAEIMVRRGLFLLNWTGQRVSDMVKLGWNHFEDDGSQPGFDLGWRGQTKTGVRPFCPIWPELLAELQTWPRRLGPFLYQEDGSRYDAQLFRSHFYKYARDVFEALGPSPERDNKPATVHGLRASCVVRLKRPPHNFSGEQISDMVGLSVAQVTNYTKFEDKKAGVRAAVAPVIEAARLEQARAKRQRAKLAIVKRLETGKARD